MKGDQKLLNADAHSALQSDTALCNLQTGRKLETSENKHLPQFADCSHQIARTPCNLPANSSPTRLGASFPDCTQTHSPFGRDEPMGAPSPEGEGLACSRPVIVCLDLGTTTGWALHSAHGVITSGTVNFKNDRWQGGGMRFLKFTRFLHELNAQAGPVRAVFFEEVRRHLGVDAAHAYGGFMAHLSAWCEQHDIAYEAVPVGTIKRHATGKGNAGKTQMIDAAKARGHLPADDNEADALALAYWVLDERMGGL